MSRSRDFDALLDRAASTRRTSAIALEASRGAALLLGAWVCALALDRVVSLPGALRLALLVVLGPVGVAAFAWRLARVARTRPSRAEAARLLEMRMDLVGNPLIDAVLLAEDARTGPPGVERGLADHVVDEAQRVSGRVDSRIAGESRRVVKAASSLGLVATAILVAVLLWPSASGAAFGRFLRPLAVEEVAAPGGVALEVTPGAVRVVAGTSLDVKVRARADVAASLPGDADLEVETEGAATRRVPMTARAAVGDTRRFEARLVAAAAPARYRVLAGAARSSWYRIDVLLRPEAAGLTARLVPPAYAGREAEDVTVGPAGQR